jgi:nucleoside-diphosphate-sugar epimerase
MISAMQGKELSVNGKSETLDFTYVTDAADGVVAAATIPQAANNTYNITKSHSWTLYDAAELAVKIAGNGTINVKDKDMDFPSRGALNIDSARADLGFDPKVDLEEGFERYYEWFKDSVYWSEKAVPQSQD